MQKRKKLTPMEKAIRAMKAINSMEKTLDEVVTEYGYASSKEAMFAIVAAQQYVSAQKASAASSGEK